MAACVTVRDQEVCLPLATLCRWGPGGWALSTSPALDPATLGTGSSTVSEVQSPDPPVPLELVPAFHQNRSCFPNRSSFPGGRVS